MIIFIILCFFFLFCLASQFVNFTSDSGDSDDCSPTLRGSGAWGYLALQRKTGVKVKPGENVFFNFPILFQDTKVYQLSSDTFNVLKDGLYEISFHLYVHAKSEATMNPGVVLINKKDDDLESNRHPQRVPFTQVKINLGKKETGLLFARVITPLKAGSKLRLNATDHLFIPGGNLGGLFLVSLLSQNKVSIAE